MRNRTIRLVQSGLDADAWRLSRIVASDISAKNRTRFRGIENAPRYLRHPLSRLYSANVSVDAPPNSLAPPDDRGVFRWAILPPPRAATIFAHRRGGTDSQPFRPHLEKHRTYGTGPAYRKIGGRVVRCARRPQGLGRSWHSRRPPAIPVPAPCCPQSGTHPFLAGKAALTDVRAACFSRGASSL